VALVLSNLHDALRVPLARAAREEDDALGRLATGLRVRRAADDAAGLGIATQLRATRRSLGAARRNARDGLSALRVADGGLSSIADVLVRLRELATAAANDTRRPEDRMSVQAEVDAQIAEIDRTARSTRFGDRRLLAPYHLLVGVLIDTSASMGGEMAALAQAIGNFQATIQGAGLSVAFGLVEVDTAPSKDPVDGTAALADFGSADLASILQNTPVAFGPVDPYASMLESVGASALAGTREPDALSWNQPADERHLVYVTDTGRETDLMSAPDSQDDVAAALRAAGVRASVVGDPANFAEFAGITGGTNGLLLDKGDAQGAGIAAAFDTLAQTVLDAAPNDPPIEVQVGTDGTDHDRVPLGLPADATSAGLGLAGLSVRTAEEARDALGRIDGALDTLASLRARLGAVANRLSTTTRRQDDADEALAASAGRVLDADVARETARAARAELMRSAAAGMLVRAGTLRASVIGRLLAPP